MDTSVDDGNGQKVGSHIKMDGKVLGIKLFLNEVVTHHDPPHIKTWETVGTPELLVVGHYIMGIEITPQQGTSLLRVFIDYDLPDNHPILGLLFGGIYAKWCVRQMLQGTATHFK